MAVATHAQILAHCRTLRRLIPEQEQKIWTLREFLRESHPKLRLWEQTIEMIPPMDFHKRDSLTANINELKVKISKAEQDLEKEQQKLRDLQNDFDLSACR